MSNTKETGFYYLPVYRNNKFSKSRIIQILLTYYSLLMNAFGERRYYQVEYFDKNILSEKEHNKLIDLQEKNRKRFLEQKQ